MSKYILGINTTGDPIEICLVDKDNDVFINEFWQKNKNESKEVLTNIDKFISSNNLKVSDIVDLIVVRGEGGYTGTRIGVSIANMFAYVRGISLYGILDSDLDGNSLLEFIKSTDCTLLKKEDLVIPKYSSPPRITN